MSFNDHVTARQDQVSAAWFFSKLSVLWLQCIISVAAFTFSLLLFSKVWSQPSLWNQTSRAADAKWMIKKEKKKNLWKHKINSRQFYWSDWDRKKCSRKALCGWICKTAILKCPFQTKDWQGLSKSLNWGKGQKHDSCLLVWQKVSDHVSHSCKPSVCNQITAAFDNVTNRVCKALILKLCTLFIKSFLLNIKLTVDSGCAVAVR